MLEHKNNEGATELVVLKGKMQDDEADRQQLVDDLACTEEKLACAEEKLSCIEEKLAGVEDKLQQSEGSSTSCESLRAELSAARESYRDIVLQVDAANANLEKIQGECQ